MKEPLLSTATPGKNRQVGKFGIVSGKASTVTGFSGSNGTPVMYWHWATRSRTPRKTKTGEEEVSTGLRAAGQGGGS